MVPVRFDQGDEFLLSRRTARLMPVLVFGGLAIAAVGVLGLQYYLGHEEPREAAAIEVAEDKAARIEVVTEPVISSPNQEIEVAYAVAPEPAAPLTEQVVMPPAPLAVAPHKPPPLAELPVAKAVVNNSAARKVATPLEVPAAAPVQPPPPKIAVVTPVVESPGALIPVQAATPAPPAAPIPLIDEATAQQVILRFRSAYASGNIQQIGALLVHAGQGGGDERQSILESYGELFKMSASRRIELHEPNWLIDGDTAILLASFDAWVVPRGESRSQRFEGDIRFDLRLEDGELRIARLRQNSRQG